MRGGTAGTPLRSGKYQRPPLRTSFCFDQCSCDQFVFLSFRYSPSLIYCNFSIMNFYNLLFAIGACCFPTEQIQMFDELPVELVIQILSFLDPKSLSIMSRMNKRLFHICKNNKGLRTTIRRYLRKERKEQLKKMLNPVKVRVLRREPENTDVVFQRQNTRREAIVTRNFEPSQVSQRRSEDPHVVFRRQNSRTGADNFESTQVLPTMKRPIAAAVSKKRSRGGQGKDPGPGHAKRMRI